MEHVRVGDDHVGRGGADAAAGVVRGVAVVDFGGDAGRAGERGQVAEGAELVLLQRLDGEEVEGAGLGVVDGGLDDGQVVAQGLARGGRGYDHQVTTGGGSGEGLGLVGIEFADAHAFEAAAKAGAEAGGQGGELRRPGRDDLDVRDLGPEVRA